MAVRENIQDRLQDSYQAIMLDYVSGGLDQAQNLIVSAHVSMSLHAQTMINDYECLGGALLEKECAPVEMTSSSLDNVLSRLDTYSESVKPEAFGIFPDDISVPKPIQSSLADQKKQAKWSSLLPGMKTFELDLDCKQSVARFLKVDPALKTPHHTHRGTEITLILDGAFEDETGKYQVGDLIVTDEDCHHAPVACPDQGCICMIVSAKPIKLKGLGRLLNPFLKP